LFFFTSHAVAPHSLQTPLLPKGIKGVVPSLSARIFTNLVMPHMTQVLFVSFPEYCCGKFTKQGKAGTTSSVTALSESSLKRETNKDIKAASKQWECRLDNSTYSRYSDKDRGTQRRSVGNVMPAAMVATSLFATVGVFFGEIRSPSFLIHN